MRVFIDIKVTVRAQCWRCNKTEEGIVELSTCPMRYSSTTEGQVLKSMEDDVRVKKLKGWSIIQVDSDDEPSPLSNKDLCPDCAASFEEWKKEGRGNDD